MMSRILLVCLSATTLAMSLLGQGFTNLNFESAQVIISTNIGVSQFITSANALPGWSAFEGTNQLSLVEYNYVGVTPPPPVGLFGSNANVIDGNFSVFLGGSSNDSISQTGLVPSGTESLLFDAGAPFGGSPALLVSLGGQNLSYTAISAGTNAYGLSYYVYAADISAFADQVETLTFSRYGILDDIQFSPGAIPEPSTAALVFVGSGILVYARKRRQFRFFRRNGCNIIP